MDDHVGVFASASSCRAAASLARSAVLLGLTFIGLLAQAALWLPHGDEVARQIANAHVVFNVTSVLLVLPFTPLIAAKAFEKLIPDTSADTQRGRQPSFAREAIGA